MDDLVIKVERLKNLDRSNLVEAWIAAFGQQPFKGARHASLVRGLAYHCQCRRENGLRKDTKKKLLKISKGQYLTSANPKSAKPKTRIGTQLVREWNGRPHIVHVTDQGFVLNGVTYSSLSSVAKAITGAHWSGPRFFGVRG